MNNRFEQVHHSMDLDERLSLHRRGWITKPIGQALIIVAVAAAALGFFGHGTFSRQVVRQGTATVQYERFLRNHGEAEISVSMTGVGGRSAISFPLAYIQHLRIEHIVPQPQTQLIRSGQVWYVFETEQNLLVHFYLKPQTTGNLHGLVWVNDLAIPISHFIYP